MVDLGRIKGGLKRLKPRFVPTIGLYVSILALFIYAWFGFFMPYASQYEDELPLYILGEINVFVDDDLVYSEFQTIKSESEDFIFCKTYGDQYGCDAAGLSGPTQNKTISAMGLSTFPILAVTCDGLITYNSLSPQKAVTFHEQNRNSLLFQSQWIADYDQYGIRQLFLMVYNGDTTQVEPACYIKVLIDPVDIKANQVLTVDMRIVTIIEN